MAGKEISGKCAEYYVNSKGYTREQIHDFDTERAVTRFLAIVQVDDRGDRAERHQPSGILLFTERQKEIAKGEQKLREDPALAEDCERFLAIVRRPEIPIFDRQPQTPTADNFPPGKDIDSMTPQEYAKAIAELERALGIFDDPVNPPRQK